MSFTSRRSLSSVLAFTILSASCLFRPSSSALADHLTMEIQAALAVREKILEGTITVVNRGDEPARKVHAEIGFPGGTVVREIVDLLGVRQSASFSFENSLGEMKEGTYALPITVVFHDSRLYPFSALACPKFTFGKTFSPGLSCSTTPLESGGEIVFEIKNPESFSRRIKSTFLFPREFYCPRPEISLLIEPSETKAVSFTLLHSSAIPGARYPVYCVIEFENEKRRHTLVCPGEIRFMEKGNWFKRTRWYWLAGWLLLMALAIPHKKKTGHGFLKKSIDTIKRIG
jgi:hypothetical protein